MNTDISGEENLTLGTTYPDPPAVRDIPVTFPLLLSTVAVAVAREPTPAESIIVTVGAAK